MSRLLFIVFFGKQNGLFLTKINKYFERSRQNGKLLGVQFGLPKAVHRVNVPKDDQLLPSV